jgi:hypothetical protein
VFSPSDVVLLPDAGPLITLAYAEALDLLFVPGWSLALVDMVLEEVTRSQTPTSRKLRAWAEAHALPVLPTQTFREYREAGAAQTATPKRANLGERAIQECMNALVSETPEIRCVLVFEDHKIARTGFALPTNCRKVSTRAFLLFLEQRGSLASAAEIERRALRAGRSFSSLRFPPTD